LENNEPAGNISATVAKQIAAAVSHVNVAPEFIVITEDKTRLYLMEWRERIESRGAWIAPLSLLLSLGFTFLTSTFHDALGFSQYFWQSFAMFCILASIGWLSRVLIRLYRSTGGSVDDLISKMKKGGATSQEVIDLGVTISSPVNGTTIANEPVSLRGTYRVRPTDNVIVCVRRGFVYYPQSPIVWSRNPEERTWECQPVWLWAYPENTEYGLVIARVSEDLGVWLRSYVTVADETKKVFGKARWIGAEMASLPPGFEVLASVVVTRSAGSNPHPVAS
jgi:hypothetical protein